MKHNEYLHKTGRHKMNFMQLNETKQNKLDIQIYNNFTKFTPHCLIAHFIFHIKIDFNIRYLYKNVYFTQ